MENYLWVVFIFMLLVYFVDMYLVVKKKENLEIFVLSFQVFLCCVLGTFLHYTCFQVVNLIIGFFLYCFMIWCLLVFLDGMALEVATNCSLQTTTFLKYFSVFTACLLVLCCFLSTLALVCNKILVFNSWDFWGTFLLFFCVLYPASLLFYRWQYLKYDKDPIFKILRYLNISV